MDSGGTWFGAFLCVLLSAVWPLGSTAANYNCDDPLVSALPHSAFDSSSQLFSHSNAKLNSHNGAGGWTPMESNGKQWLQIDLGERSDITGAATQGRYGSTDWVTRFNVMFSDTGRNWKPYHHDNTIWVFPGNINADGVVNHKFQHSMKARFVRFVPLEWNPSGRIGMRVEVYGCSYKSDVADFDGRSSLLYRFNQKLMTTYKDVISLKFKSMQSDGVLFHGEGQRGDYITLELQKGRLSLSINLGDAKLRFANTHTMVTLGSLLDDQHWHSVLIDRFNKQVNFTVDKYTQHFRTKGESDNLDIDYEFSFGGIPVSGKPGAFLKRNFHGCIENLYYNGVNVIDLAKRRKPQIYIGNITFSCSEPHIVPITFTSPSTSFLLLPGTPQLDDLAVSFQFRTWNSDSLLLSTKLAGDSGFLLLQLYSGKLLLMIQEKLPNILPITTGSFLNDGLWHTVAINIRRHRITLTLDNGATAPVHVTIPARISTGYQYYFGGCPDPPSDCVNPISSFQGCMRLIFIDNQPKDLILAQRGMLGNFSDLQIDMCGIRDRCLPNHCEHGGTCSQTWSTFHCDCGDTGYADATCHSCKIVKHKGYPSDYYYIDSDGSGPLGPVRVYCNLTVEKIWTIVQHNITDLMTVRGIIPGKPYSAAFNYGASAEQMEDLINNAEYCEQEVAYHCKHSRLLNSPSGNPYTWWIGRGNERHTYWGGSLPGQCACGLEESCIDMRQYCNCDADRPDWTNDTGFLTFKEHLPVSQIVITDTNRPGSEAAWKIGPLRCYGDRNFWNSASFSSTVSYLYFPTFHSDFSTDIAFFFKTNSSSGVFLESLGVKDFIRVQLSSPYQVTFSFDAGNGPMEVSLQSVTALNDGQWHHVRAERNIKETSLVVDNQPRKLVQTPFDGRPRPLLNAQLYVGGTASKQRGFMGCVRYLQLNGQTLDLEERAKVTPGIRPGCPGHCSSYGNLCHNNGKCMEKRNGYTCDCTNSAFEGPYCKKEVSAMFEAGTSVTYVFQEPYPVSRNSNASASAIYADTVISRENIAFSFVTAQAPSLLLYLDSFYQDYLAVLLCRNGSLQVRYKVGTDAVHVLTVNSKRLDNRKLHYVKINREGKEMMIQIDKIIKERHNFSSDVYFKAIKSLTMGKVLDNPRLDPEVTKANSLGFIGCLSSVQYNQLAPLKAALRHPSTAPVTVIGSLSECSCGSITDSDLSTITTTYSSSDPFGDTDDREPLTNEMRSGPVVIGGVIAITIFIIFCIVAIMTKIVYRHKKTHGKSQTREKEYPGTTDYSFRNDVDLQNTVSECKKEYFI
ncbi:PREDICTED: contactin-associated protein-like 5 [Nanorana parkeri]|uniref:contactin-associated protein-like 5 n=1 Tax=Nanorana parkeri TaxID=125878 RepID=UPI000854DEB6|nr:PREDICTED: contactin-associated protein-like 5 [Nanorana parkeri]